jgi:hypothetical protein
VYELFFCKLFFFLHVFIFKKKRKSHPSIAMESPVDIYSGPNNHLVECKLQPLISPKENRLQTLEGQGMRIEPVE